MPYSIMLYIKPLKINSFKSVRFDISDNNSDASLVTTNDQLQKFQIQHPYLLKKTPKKTNKKEIQHTSGILKQVAKMGKIYQQFL